MPVALTVEEVWEYQLLEDRLPDGKTDPTKTIFQFGTLTPTDEAEITDAEVDIAPTGAMRSYKLGTGNLVRLLRGLRGWRNFTDKDGNAVEFKTRKALGRDLCDESNLARLNVAQRHELANAHRDHGYVTVAEGN